MNYTRPGRAGRLRPWAPVRTTRSSWLCPDQDGHFNTLQRIVIPIFTDSEDLVHRVKPLAHLAEDGILPIQRAAIIGADEKLRPCAVRVIPASHRQCATPMRTTVEFRRNSIPRAP